MTRIPIEPLARSLSNESRIPVGDSRDPSVDEESRFDAHLRRAEKKSPTAPEDRVRSENDTASETEPVDEADTAESQRQTEDHGDGPESCEKEQQETRSEDDAEAPGKPAAEEGTPQEACSVAACIVETIVSSQQPATPSGEADSTLATVETVAAPDTTGLGADREGAAGSDTRRIPSSPTTAKANQSPENRTAPQTSESPSDSGTASGTTTVDAAVAQTAVVGADRQMPGKEQSRGEDTGAGENPPAELSSTGVAQVDETAGDDSDSTADSDSRPRAEEVSTADAARENAEGTKRTGFDATGPETKKDTKEDSRSTETPTKASTAAPELASAVSATSSSAATDRAAGGLSAATEPPPEAELDGPDPSRFIRRVAGAFGAASRRDSPIRVQLTPPELGTLRLEVKVERGELVARLETDTHEARNVLLDSLPALRHRLEQQDIKIQRFDIEYDAGSDGSGPAPEDRQGRQEDGRRNPAPRAARAAKSEEPSRPRPVAEVASDGRLNLFA